MAAKKRAKPRPTGRASVRARTKAPEPKRFVGRDPSPVLAKYPPKESGLGSRLTAPPTPAPSAAPPPRPTAAPAPPSSGSPAPPKPLIALERPFDLDEFAGLLGETTIRAEVPREDLAEALRRVSDFMGFGIYVYSVRVRPADGELLKRFVVELQRVDFDPSAGTWRPFEEKGRSDSPFGPTGDRH